MTQEHDPSTDLAGSSTGQPDSSSITISSQRRTPSNTVALGKQTLWQRKCLFWIVLAVITLMYAAFFYFVFKTHYFRLLVLQSNFAFAFAGLLFVVPSALLWGLIRNVFRQKEDPPSKSESSTISASEMIKLLELLKGYTPLS